MNHSTKSVYYDNFLIYRSKVSLGSKLIFRFIQRKTSYDYQWFYLGQGFPGSDSGKDPACQCRRYKRCWFDLWVGKVSWRRA